MSLDGGFFRVFVDSLAIERAISQAIDGLVGGLAGLECSKEPIQLAKIRSIDKLISSLEWHLLNIRTTNNYKRLRRLKIEL